MSDSRELWVLDDGRTFGGGQGNALRLGRHLTEADSDLSIRILCPAESELHRRCRKLGVPVVDVRFPDRSFFPKANLEALRALRRLLAAAGDEVLVVGGSLRTQVYAHAAAVGLRNKPPMIQFMTEQDSAQRKVGVLLLRRFGSVVAIGGNAARAYELALGASVVQVNNFLLPEEFEGAYAPPPDLTRPPVLGVLARLIREKGLIELLEELSSIRPSWSRLLVAGNADDPVYRRELEARIVELGLDDVVSLLGHLDDVTTFFEEAEIVVVPSVGNEGQPTVILEALAQGRPVVIRSHVWSSEFERFPVEPYRDPATLREQLEAVRLARVDRDALRSRFSVEQAVGGFVAAAKTTAPKRARA